MASKNIPGGSGEYLLGGSPKKSGPEDSLLSVGSEPPLYRPDELRAIREEARRKSAPNVTPTPAPPTAPQKLAPERFRYQWSSGRTHRDISKEAYGNMFDFTSYCEEQEGMYVLSQLSAIIHSAPQLRKPPFTGSNDMVGYFEINLRASDGKIFHWPFAIYAC